MGRARGKAIRRTDQTLSMAVDGIPRRARRRGRPSKFGRPSQVIALTLPEDALQALRTLHHDPAWAIVQLIEKLEKDDRKTPATRSSAGLAELVRLADGRSLIVVQPEGFGGLKGVSTIPLADGRAFLAFDHSGGIADLEVAVLDKLDASRCRAERGKLSEIRNLIRAWRRDQELAFKTKSIIVVETARRRRPVSTAPRLPTANTT